MFVHDYKYSYDAFTACDNTVAHSVKINKHMKLFNIISNYF